MEEYVSHEETVEESLNNIDTNTSGIESALSDILTELKSRDQGVHWVIFIVLCVIAFELAH